MTVDVGYAPLSGMVVGVDGSITYDFDGHIHAQGLDLDAVNAAFTPAALNMIRWLRTADASEAAKLYGHASGMELFARNYADAGSGIVLHANRDGDPAGALLQVTAAAGSGDPAAPDYNGVSRVSVGASNPDGSGVVELTVIDALGNSGFVRNAGDHQASIDWDGSALLFYIDDILVAFIDANPYPREV